MSPNFIASRAREVHCSLASPDDRESLRRALASEPVQLKDWLGAGPAAPAVALIAVDLPALRRLRPTIERLRLSIHPQVVPVVLLTRDECASLDGVANEVGDVIDNVIRLPMDEATLRSRITPMLRIGELSFEQSQAHRSARQALDGVSRALRTLDACNEVLLRERDETDMLQQICTVITRFEEYALAWVGFTELDEADPARVGIVAMAGRASGYAQKIDVRSDESAKGNGPAGRAIATGRTQIFDDLQTDEAMRPWQTAIREWELGAAIALPLQLELGGRGVLIVYSSRAGDFEPAERELLERLAINVSVGIDKLRLREQRRRQEAEIHELSFSDLLTGLPNRRFLENRLARVLSASDSGRVAAALFIDLRDFKLVNDALGYHIGDQVLRKVAARIQSVMRPGDMLARKGEDEFIAVMIEPYCASEMARKCVEEAVRTVDALAERILESIRRPLNIRGVRHRIDANIGISVLPYSARTPTSLIEQAETAMYQAKRNEQALVFYTRALGMRRQRRLDMEARLHRALENGEFSLHYQPVWKTDTGGIVGVEALLRWEDEVGNRISPGEFIPVAEEIGLIGPIGDWVLHNAACQLSQWRAQQFPLWVSVNISVSQLLARQAAARIGELVTPALGTPEGLHLELTEDTLMRSPHNVLESLHGLAEQGFRLSLDDFGKGYSSLARLHSLPLHTLKIDKLFVDRLDDASGVPIVEAIVELARCLSLNIVAEGIETTRQRDRLGAMGAVFGQGFLVSAARPSEEIPALMRNTLTQ